MDYLERISTSWFAVVFNWIIEIQGIIARISIVLNRTSARNVIQNKSCITDITTCAITTTRTVRYTNQNLTSVCVTV